MIGIYERERAIADLRGAAASANVITRFLGQFGLRLAGVADGVRRFRISIEEKARELEREEME